MPRRSTVRDAPSTAFAPEQKQSLSDRLARRIRGMVQRGHYRVGDRLPSIMEMATAQHLREMRRLLTTAGKNLADDDVLHTVNMSFHRQIALASGNAVLVQLLDVLRDLFTEEQRLILKIFASRERDHEDHVAI